VITGKFFILHDLYQETYNKLKTWIKKNKGFSCSMMGSITLTLQVGLKILDVSSSIISMSNRFHVNLGYPSLCSMDVIPLVHKFLKFPFENNIFTLHHSRFNPFSSHRNFSLLFFWCELMEPIEPHEHLFFLYYQKFKEKCIENISLQNMPELTILDETMIKPKENSQDQPKKIFSYLILNTKRQLRQSYNTS
jgi:hypothetical protein